MYNSIYMKSLESRSVSPGTRGRWEWEVTAWKGLQLYFGGAKCSGKRQEVVAQHCECTKCRWTLSCDSHLNFFKKRGLRHNNWMQYVALDQPVVCSSWLEKAFGDHKGSLNTAWALDDIKKHGWVWSRSDQENALTPQMFTLDSLGMKCHDVW